MSLSLLPRPLLLGVLVLGLAACDSSDPDPTSEPGPIMPGETYTFDFTAGPGMHLSFDTSLEEHAGLFALR